LVTLDGKVIGINTAISQGANGIGFAIPISEVRNLIDNVLRSGRIERAYLGVNFAMTEEGAYVSGVMEGSPAENAGIQPGDIIVSVNRQVVELNRTLSSIISRYRVGDRVEIILMRGDERVHVATTLEELE
jgi:S1-C subfamily serine protease